MPQQPNFADFAVIIQLEIGEEMNLYFHRNFVVIGNLHWNAPQARDS